MLEGTLDDFDLRFILRFLSFTRKTGKLTVEGPAGAGRLFFRDGEVYHAESDARRRGFGRKLVDVGKLTEEQLRQTLEYCAARGTGLGEGLVSRGVVGRSDLELVLREEIEEVARGLLRNESGRFRFAPGEEVDSDTLILVRVEALLEHDGDALERTVPVLQTAPVGASRSGGAEPRDVTVSAEEWRVIASIDGRRTISDIAARLGARRPAVLRTLGGLVSAGLVSLPGHPSADAEPAPGAGGARAPEATSGPPPEPGERLPAPEQRQPPPPPRPRRVPPPPPPPRPVALGAAPPAPGRR